MKLLNVAKTAVVAVSGAVTSLAMAAGTPPTTAAELAAAVDMSDAKAAGLTIIGLLVAAGVVLWGARLVLSKFAPRV